MAIQEFDRPLRRAEQRSGLSWEYYLSIVLLMAAIAFVSLTILTLPGPAGERPLAYQPINEMPVRWAAGRY